MNYRHVYHAGNFADVHKHVGLVAILQHLAKKDKAFIVIDTHAARGSYDLASAEAMRTAEAADGVERLLDYNAASPALRKYLQLVRSLGTRRYPGSPLVAAKLIGARDRLVAIEKHPEEFALLKAALAPFRNARVIEGDGYALLPPYLPPRERRGLILIDPPYEVADEFERISDAVVSGYRHFATGIFMIWYPLKVLPRVEALAGEILSAGVRSLLNVVFDVGAAATEPERLSAAGYLLVNPPFEFDRQIRQVDDELLPLLARGADAATRVDWIAGPH